MKINRLLEIVTILLNRQTVTAKELAGRFEVSTRTIYRDIDALSLAGVPVYTDKGRGGGISLLENFTLNKALLSTRESEGLLLALKTMRATSYPEADLIMEKLGSIFKNNKAHDWIEVDFAGWSSSVNEKNKFSKIRDAIINKQVISFDYINSDGGRSHRHAEPFKLIFNAFTWYLIAFCHLRNSQRMFRLSRIKNVELTDQFFLGREILEEEWQDSELNLIELKLRCQEKVLSRLYDTFAEQFISKNDQGSYDLTVPILDGEWIYGYILSLGKYAEVLAPKQIREIIKSRAEDVWKMYS